jgi:hypothetical protein
MRGVTEKARSALPPWTPRRRAAVVVCAARRESDPGPERGRGGMRVCGVTPQPGPQGKPLAFSP